MGLRFIFMLTRNDRTVPKTRRSTSKPRSASVSGTSGSRNRLAAEQLKALSKAIKAGGASRTSKSCRWTAKVNQFGGRQQPKSASMCCLGARMSMTSCRIIPVPDSNIVLSLVGFRSPERARGHDRGNCRKREDNRRPRRGARPGPVRLPFGRERPS